MTHDPLVATEIQRPGEAITRQLDASLVSDGSPTFVSDGLREVDEIAGTSTDAETGRLSGSGSQSGSNVTARALTLSAADDNKIFHHWIRFNISGAAPVEYYFVIRCTDRRPTDT